MKYRKFKGENDTMYYVPVDVLNAADEIHVDTGNKGPIKGYGGATIRFEMEDGTTEAVVGPWHTNSRGLFKDTGISLSELHLMKIKLTEYETGEVLYEESQPVLGSYYRGYRAGRQLAILRGVAIEVYQESNGGSSTHMEYPHDRTHDHPLSIRKEDKC